MVPAELLLNRVRDKSPKQKRAPRGTPKPVCRVRLNR